MWKRVEGGSDNVDKVFFVVVFLRPFTASFGHFKQIFGSIWPIFTQNGS